MTFKNTYVSLVCNIINIVPADFMSIEVDFMLAKFTSSIQCNESNIRM